MTVAALAMLLAAIRIASLADAAGASLASVIILGAAALGLVTNTLVILGVSWRGGRLLGAMETAFENHAQKIESVTAELRGNREKEDERLQVLARVVAQLDAVEKRVDRIERESDRRRGADRRQTEDLTL